MKLHRPIVSIIVTTLEDIFEKGMYADKTVPHIFKNNKSLGGRDRRFIAETIYEMVRWRRLIEEACEAISPVNYYHLFGAWMLMKGVPLPEWEEFHGLDTTKTLAAAAAAKEVRKYRESIPDWLDETGANELGEDVWTEELVQLNREALVVLRVNTLKTTAHKLQKKVISLQLPLQSIPYEIPLWDDVKKSALVLFKRQKLHHLKEYKQGLFEIQDASSQLIAPYLELKEGMTVIDACAGAGGKSLHMAAMMKNRGKIIAMDVEEKKLGELRKRAHRAGATIIDAQLINDATVAALANTADRLLLDVPCSGLGVLKRNPDTKWKMTPERLTELKTIQQTILQDYSVMLKPDGIMVYATCSILPSENEDQVQTFLKNHPTFTLLKEEKVMPSDGFDGFYMAALSKTSD